MTNHKLAMRYLFLLFLSILLLPASAGYGQSNISFGKIPLAEKDYSTFAKDPEAAAVVLYEKGDNYFEVIKNYIRLVKKYHVRTKILSDKGFDEGTVSIRYLHNNGSAERLENIRAVTHNGDKMTYVLPENIFTKDLGPNVSVKTFTFPDLKVGAILEYEYTLISPFIYNFKGWSFQSNIPKLYSEFNATIPGYYNYNRNLTGALQLHTNEAKLVKECFKIEGTIHAADCEKVKYVMKDIPAFKKEGYMLAASNYISRIDFELAEHHLLNGVTNYYTKSWEDVDDELKNDRDLGIQLNKKGYLERNVPESLLTEGDALTRAKNIYEFVRNHYTWTGEYGIYSDTRVKEAFDARRGNIAEINISLINLFNAAGLPANMMLMSTRENGLPNRTHPVMNDFNYVLAHLEIEGKTYLLDASEPILPFGILPFRCLNYYGRVMDFKKGSYWKDIVVTEPSRVTMRAQITFGPDMKAAEGVMDEINLGYEAIARRWELLKDDEDAYLDQKESSMAAVVEISNYSINSDKAEEKVVSERFGLKLTPQPLNGSLYFNPFLLSLFEQEPFYQEDRQFPVDFGYPRSYSYTMIIVLPEGYKVEKLPSPEQVSLKDQVASLKFDVSHSGNMISFLFNFSLNYPHVKPEYYKDLKELFSRVNELQKNSVLVINKV